MQKMKHTRRAKTKKSFRCWAMPLRFSEDDAGNDLNPPFDRYYACAPHETKRTIKKLFPDSARKLVRMTITIR